MFQNMAKTSAADLTPPHLSPPSLAEAKAALDEKGEKAEDLAPDGRTAPEYIFDFSFQNAQRTYAGKFKNRILNIRQQRAVGVLRASLSGGVPFESLDGLTSEMSLVLAHLTHSLDEKMRPEWAKDLEALDDYRVLQALYQEVAQHEATFLGGAKTSGTGEKA